MDDPTSRPPITDIQIRCLQSISDRLCDPMIVSLVFESFPETMESTVSAIKTAMDSAALPDSPPQTEPAPNKCYRSRIESLLPLFPRSDLWARSGLTRNQLDRIREAFMNAQKPLAGRLDTKETKEEEKRRIAEFARQAKVQKVKNRYR